jgi:pyridoxine 5-phosphate synthase
LHTGSYAQASNIKQRNRFFKQLKIAISYALSQGLIVNVGHGLDYSNVRRLASIYGIEEFNIGYSIITRALYTGLFKAVREMRELLK